MTSYVTVLSVGLFVFALILKSAFLHPSPAINTMAARGMLYISFFSFISCCFIGYNWKVTLAPKILVGGVLSSPLTPCALPVVLENSGSVHSFVFGRNIKRFLPVTATLTPLIAFL